MFNKHLIGKQVMELEISSSKNAYAIQQAISDLVWNALVSEVNQLFDTMVGKDEVVRLDRIEIDLGEIALQEGYTKTIVDQIVRLLEEKCTAAIREIHLQKQSEPYGVGNQAQQPLRSHHFRVWLYWLEHGTLPTFAVAPKTNWLEGVLETLAMEDEAIGQLKHLLKHRPMAVNRLALQHSPKDLKSLVELYTGHSQTELLDFFMEVQEFIKRNLPAAKVRSFRKIEVNLWKSVFRLVILKRAKLESKLLVQILVKQPELAMFHTEFMNKPKKYTKTYPLLSEAFQKTTLATREKENKGPVDEAVPSPLETAKGATEVQDLENNKKMASPQFFTNAGIVLLHPFLKKFFEKLKLSEGPEFKDFDSHCTAVLLLHFLAGSEDSIPDYGLILPKFLCAMPVNLPLDHTLKLSVAEKEEGINLLKAVIDHWGALGSTSPDGLREGFLLREGKLTKEQTGWKLHVEQKAMDILLDRLPWNLSIVKLPWMKEVLYVEWR